MKNSDIEKHIKKAEEKLEKIEEQQQELASQIALKEAAVRELEQSIQSMKSLSE